VALAFVFATTGCGGGLQPVRGKVTLEDGSPVTKGMVVFESLDSEKPITARGDIQADGSYELSTYRAGDGARPGKYRVLIAPRVDPEEIDAPHPTPPAFDKRYTDFRTSGLELEVKAGANELPIQVARPGKAGR
jgi:hypothetical protein